MSGQMDSNERLEHRALPDTDAMMARARELMGERYALESGVHPRFDHMALHSNLIGLGAGLSCLAALMLPSYVMELTLAAVSAMLARVIYVQMLIGKLNLHRPLGEGEARAWANQVARLSQPPKPSMIATAVDALNHPHAKVIDLARQCTTIAALEASLACRQRHGVPEAQG